MGSFFRRFSPQEELLMRSFVTQPVRRLMMITLAALCVVLTAAAASAQEPAAAAAPAQPDPMKFSSGVAMVLNEIKPEKAADFEAVWSEIKAGLSASDKPELQQQATSFKMFKVGVDLPAGANHIYVLYIDPVPTVTFDPVKILYESGAFEREKADELYKKLDGAYARINPWPLIAVGR
jgi:hypothetical protein